MPRTHDLNLPDLSGTCALVTGASDGIGRVIATRLAEAGAELVLPVRNPAKGLVAADRIRASVPDAVVSTRALDLSSLASIAATTAELRSEGSPIHLLVANAGVMRPPTRQVTADGFELQMGTNHLGHVALVLGLLPLLRAGRARVTHQTSIAARTGLVDPDALARDQGDDYDVMRAYSASKTAVGLFARELDARSRAGGWGISSNLAHPGVSPTNLLAAQPGMGRTRVPVERRLIGLLSRIGVTGTVESAALPALQAAADVDATGDEFYGPTRAVGGPPTRIPFWEPLTDMERARRLWDASERLVGARVSE
jgi:NAD(P)-dependent dehydrogenase (short-subunit alcohol dehydrogenase family)